MAINNMMCILGADGEVHTDSECVRKVMNALHDLDGGQYDLNKVFGNIEKDQK